MAKATTVKVDPRLVQTCRRGDVIAWATLRDYSTNADGGVYAPVRLYTIGIVRSVTRDGLVKTADTGMGIETVSHDLDAAGVRGEVIDMDKARAWLKSAANYPRAGSTPLRSMDEVRAVVRLWLKEV